MLLIDLLFLFLCGIIIFLIIIKRVWVILIFLRNLGYLNISNIKWILSKRRFLSFGRSIKSGFCHFLFLISWKINRLILLCLVILIFIKTCYRSIEVILYVGFYLIQITLYIKSALLLVRLGLLFVFRFILNNVIYNLFRKLQVFNYLLQLLI